MERFYNNRSVGSITNASDGFYTSMIKKLGLQGPDKMRTKVLGLLCCALFMSATVSAQVDCDDFTPSIDFDGVTAETCDGAGDGTITVGAFSGIPPYVINLLNDAGAVVGTTTGVNPTVFGDLAPGTYSVEVGNFDPGTATVVSLDPANALGFMNVFNLDGSFVFNSGWGVQDLVANFDAAGNVTLAVNQIEDPNEFWYQGGRPGEDPNDPNDNGGPGAPGNKIMEAILFNEVMGGGLAGQEVSFTVEVTDLDFSCGHASQIFIRDFTSDFSGLNQALVPIPGPGVYTVTLNTSADPTNVVQYGFITTGVNVWSTDAAACGTLSAQSALASTFSCGTTLSDIVVDAGASVTVDDIAVTESCDGENLGTATVTATGSGDLEYSINGGPFSVSNVASGLAAGSYTATVRVAGTDCSASSPFEITAIVTNAPTVVAADDICEGETLAAPLEASCDAGVVNWFSEQFGGTFLATGDTYDPIAAGSVNSNIPGTYTFWAECASDPCLSERVAVMFTVFAAPAEVAISSSTGGSSVCPGSAGAFTVDPVNAASTYEWFVNGVSQGTGAQIDLSFDDSSETAIVSVAETNENGCTTTTTTTVTVETNETIACKSLVVASLGSNCDATLSAGLFVQDNAYPSSSYAVTSVTNTGTGEVLEIDADGGFTVSDKGTFTIAVTHICSGNVCWSTLTTEDNTAPTIVCPDTKFVSCDGDLKPVFPDDYPEVADNCGIDASVPETFTFVDSNTIPGETFTGFSGAFGEINWTDEITGGDGTIDFSENALTIVSDDSGAGATETNTSFTFTLGGELSFDWDFFNADLAGFDFAAVTVDAMGVVTDIVPEVTDSGSGSVASFAIDAGSTLLISTSSVDGLFGAGTLTITNFSFVTQETVLDPNDECNGGVYRTWFATDDCGNVSETCSQLVLRTRPDVVDFPVDVTLECNNDATPSTDPEATGYPTINIDGVDVDLDGKTCNYLATFTDITIPASCADKILREWTVFDWCAGEIVDIVDQFITVMDNSAPTIECPEDVDVVSNAASCEGNYTIPNPTVTDGCSSSSLVITLSDGTVVSPGMTINIDEQETITYAAADECGNAGDVCTQVVTVLDETAPVAICDQNTVVSLGNNGLGLVCATTVDDGSYDNCNDDLTILVKRMDAPNNVPFTPCVEFDCADANETVLVRFRVFDDNGFGECMVNVNVQDKLGPAITCPPSKNLNCSADLFPNEVDSTVDEDLWNTTYNGELIGFFPFIDNCGPVTIEITDAGALDLCGEGTILRTWTASDLGASASCVQTIDIFKTAIATFTGNDVPGDDDDIIFPADVDLDCTQFQNDSSVTDPVNAGEPELIGEEDDCAQLFIGYDDQFLFNDPTACLKILRTWQVIDHCQYDPNNGVFDGFWQHTQLIKVDDETDPIFDNCDDEIATIDGVDGCAGEVTVTRTASDACDMELDYTWTVVRESGEVDNGEGSTFTIDDLEVGTHIVTWTATDNCENVETCTHELKVNDGKQPTPVCVVLYTAVMPSVGMVEVWASDFESGSSFDNCTAHEDLNRYILPADAPIPAAGSDISDLPTNITFTCDQLGFQNVHVFVEDESGNWDFCLTQVWINDSQGVCTGEPMALIQGNVETEDHDMVEDVNVMISGNGMSITGSDGLFSSPVAPNNNYTVTPEKDINWGNGVTTFDLVLISQHILGVQALDSPYKIIAADANMSNSVTTLDIVKLQRLILGLDQDLAPNTSWRFVDMDFVFADNTNPFATTFPEVISYNDLSTSELSTDFIGVKIGDVNNSATPNNLLGSAFRNTNGTLEFDLEDRALKAGETYEVALTANDFINVLGFQYTINVDNAEILDVIPGTITNADNFGMSDIANGNITTSWFNAKSTSLTNDEVVYTIKLKANENTRLSEVLSVSSSITKAEAYNSTDLLDVAFNFTNSTTTATAFELYQNRPNPFKANTAIGFNLPEAGTVTLQILDLSGRVLVEASDDFAKGYNEFTMNNNIEGTGVFYYRIETATDTATKKMIILE